jgi:hypothetical protein
MKTRLTFFVLILFFLSLEGIRAQSGLFGGSAVPLQPQSPLFGKDIVIHDSSSQNQRQVVICSAFNGWLYAAYTYFNTEYNMPAFEILKSVDNGITWTLIVDEGTNPVYSEISSLDIAVAGDSISNLKLFVSFVSVNGNPGDIGYGFVGRYDGDGNFLDRTGELYYVTYIAIATDFMYPASNSNPFSIGILYSDRNFSNQDSLIFLSSSNGGMSYNNRQVLAITSNHFHDVSLAYGRSPSWSSGRYFAAWTETNGFTSYTGHIYTAHSNPDFNSPFTKPVCIDSLDSTGINKFKNPKIACQFSSSDNDSSNLTEVIMAEKQLSLNNYDTRGFYNLHATTSSHFNEFSLTSSSNNKTQPDINFNPYASAFMVTYYDSTLQSLPFLTNDVNLTNPGTWNIISPAYNDSPNLAAPYPKVALDMGQQQGADVWIKEGTGGNGVAMFDAQYSTYAGVSDNNSGTFARLIGAYPNPCSSYIKIAFELQKPEKVTIILMNILDQPLGTVTDQYYSEGKHVVNYDVSNFPEGTYIYNFRSANLTTAGKFTMIR